MGTNIVVGVDFGTTYSGIAWAVNSSYKTVRLVDEWPDAQDTLPNPEKVPTALSYKDGELHHWGYSVRGTSLRWFKLLLDPRNSLGSETPKVLETIKQLNELDKTVEQVAADYMRKLWEHAIGNIAKYRGANWASFYTLRCVLAIPEIWSTAAKDKILAIARMAGLPDDVRILLESEAAALAMLKDRSKEDKELEVGDCFVVCDIGNEQVLLSNYEICCLDPLQIQACEIEDVTACDSILINEAFEKYIKMIIGEEQYRSIPTNHRFEMMREFDTIVKPGYSGDETPYAVHLHGAQDNPSEYIEHDQIKLEPTLLQTLFDHAIGKISRLIEEYIEEAQEQGKQIKAILPVGGFGSNEYMYKRLTELHPEGSDIQVLQNSRGWSSICRGATIWGLEIIPDAAITEEPSTPVPDTGISLLCRPECRRTADNCLGVCYPVPYDESKGHLFSDRIRSPSGEWLVENQMDWIVREGDFLSETTVITRHFERVIPANWFSNHKFLLPLLHINPDYMAPRLDDCEEDGYLYRVHCEIHRNDPRLGASFKDPLTKKYWRRAYLELRVLAYFPMCTHIDVYLLGDPKKPFVVEKYIGSDTIRDWL